MKAYQGWVRTNDHRRQDVRVCDHGESSHAPETSMTVAQGVFNLRRLPERHDPSLRAWDAADEYVLRYLQQSDIAGTNWLVANDLFGALAVALNERRPQSWGDSVTSHDATVANLDRNGCEPADVTLVPSTDVPTGPIDVAVIKVPRSLALLNVQLRVLKPLLHKGSVVVGAGMVKAIHRSTLELFERTIGPSPTSLAKKKARLIHATVDHLLPVEDLVEPTTYRLASGQPVVEYANVFSRGKLDIGTRAMLDHLPPVQPGADVLDLGCGNGLLGLTVAQRAPLTSLTFVDESYHATASAAATAERWETTAPCRFLTACTLQEVHDNSMDLVLNNPPFHNHQSRSEAVALAMFDDARRVLRPGGRLVVVGNRHLGYHRRLGHRFTPVEVIGSTPKFVVLSATRT